MRFFRFLPFGSNLDEAFVKVAAVVQRNLGTVSAGSSVFGGFTARRPDRWSVPHEAEPRWAPPGALVRQHRIGDGGCSRPKQRRDPNEFAYVSFVPLAHLASHYVSVDLSMIENSLF